MQSDGNFVVYDGTNFTASNARWNTKTNGNNSYFAFQTDGNLVVYNQSNKAVWSPNIHGKGATRLTMQNDGNLVAYGVNNKAIWSTNSQLKGNLDKIDVYWWGVSVYISSSKISKETGAALSYGLGEALDSIYPGAGTLVGLAVEYIGLPILRSKDKGYGIIINITWAGIPTGFSAQTQ